MSYSKKFSLAALGASLIYCSSLVAGISRPWEAAPFTATPADVLKAAAADTPKDADVVILSRDTHYVFDAEGKKTMTERTVFRIVNATAIENWSAISAPYAPWYQDRPSIRARVITTDGAVHELDPSTIDDAPAAEGDTDVYSDNRILQAPLPALAQGAVVEEEVTIHDKALFFAAGSTDRTYFYEGAPIRHAVLTIEAPTSLALTVVNRLGATGHETRTESSGVSRIVFEMSDLTVPEDLESSVPNDVHQLPYVAFSTGKSWNEVAKQYSAIVDKQIADYKLPESLRLAVNNAPTREAKIALLLARLHQDVRYTGIEFGEASIVPRTPSEVLRRKYGDCKDKAAFLVSMLRNAGIPANVAALRAGYGADVESELPGFGVFNHAIVVVPGEPALWIDPTDEYGRAGELPGGDQGRLALIADAKSDRLVTTPRLSSKENRIVQTRKFTLSEDGPASVVETSAAHGAMESEQRHFYAESDAKSLKEAMKQYAHNVFNSDADPQYHFSTPSDMSVPFVSTVEVPSAKRGITDRGVAAVGIFPSGLLERLPWAVRDTDDSEDEKKKDEKKSRKYDFVFPEAFAEEWHYVIQPPVGFRARELPASEERAIGPFKLVRKFTTGNDGVVTADLSFEVNQSRITPEQFEKMRTDIKALEQEPVVLVNFELTASALLESGNVRDGLAELRKLSRLHPKEALHHSQLALALLDAGLGEQARAEARAAVKLDPKSADAQRTLGWVLQHDLLGRRFHKGFDYEGALAAYREMKKLDPDDAVGRADFAILLEHDANGARYTKASHLSEAIAEYRAIRKELKNESMNDNILFALMWSHDFAGLRDEARELQSASTREAMMILAAARLEGTDAAFRAGDALVSDKDRRRSALASAAGYLLQLREYKQSTEFLERLTSGAPNASEMTARIAVLKNATRVEEKKFAADDPTAVVQRFLLVAMSRDEPTAATLLPLFAEELRPTISKELTSFVAGLRAAGVRPGLDDERGVPHDVVVDLAFAAMKFVKEGDDKLGYRIRAEAQVGGDGPDSNFYVVKEGNEYRLAGVSLAPSTMAPEISRRIAAGDTAGARQWLDWARDEMRGADDDHPFAENPLVRFWRKGSNPDDANLKLAAAALAVLGDVDMSAKAVSELLAARSSATADVQTSIDVALLSGYARMKKADEMLVVAQRLLAQRNDSDEAFTAAAGALATLGRFDDVRKMAEERLAKNKKDVVALRTLSEVAGQKSQYDESAKYLQAIIDRGEASASDYNSLAWLALFQQPFADQSITTARKAADLAGNIGASAILHTLAALYAEAGKTTEARQVILREMDVAGSAEPRSEDWYVLGRIAEQYGETDAAAALYRKVEKPKRDDVMPLSTYLLAEKRLKAIGAR